MLLRLQLSQEREEGEGGVRRARPAQQPITYACDRRIDMHNVVRGARVAAAGATIQRAITINFGRDSVRRQRNRTFPLSLSNHDGRSDKHKLKRKVPNRRLPKANGTIVKW